MKFFSTPCQEVTVDSIVLRDPVFISDLHLNGDDSDTIDGFLHFLDDVASQHQELVILGDLFDYWVGDDAIETVSVVIEALKKYSEKHSLYIMHGNRDFMMGEDFGKACGATMLADPCVTSNQGVRILLSHGDIWCTDDEVYQKVRRKVRGFWWQWTMLRLPLRKRLDVAENARAKSKATKQDTEASKMDVVNAEVVKTALQKHAHAVIHGHTHQPSIVQLDGPLNRYVLSDWLFKDGRAVRGNYIVISDNKPVLKNIG
ncbi:MAG: UDP-2,3-diacylglucosamine diphosphatase [Burkholderiaceae bacterium]|nr:UDP-2,3-diacylglucosamine diphosphatase [Burkholderiaceae bacterium]